MLRRLLLLFLTVSFCSVASAQFRYTFKDTTTPYVPLSTGTSVNGSDIWDEESYDVPMPFTWKLDSSISLGNLNLILSFPGFIADTSDFSDVSGFILGGTDIADRGNLTQAASLSPIRYATTGSAPNRIFKVELYNAGFYGEYTTYNTMDDSMNVQMWIYETSNIIELHFGPSRITYPSVYFGGGTFFSFISHADFYFGSKGKFYYVASNSGTLGIDSISITSSTGPANLPSSWPSNGEVYRFTPRKFCSAPASGFTAGTPAGLTNQYTYTGTTTGVDSLVWDFGDGQKLKVTSAFTTPVSHTYAAAGKYNVKVTAYSNCGSSTSAIQQSAVAVGNIIALGNVQVYPNPAHNSLIIQGMKPGGKASVLSLLGQTLLHTDINTDKQSVDLAALPAGTYMLLLADAEGNSAQQRFVKQ
jgi:PKD repeat protein